jgi:cytochrome c556
VRTTAGRLLSRELARHTLAEMLGQGRDAFAEGFRTTLQRGLDDLSSGIEVIAVIVGAIHPPPAAAPSYRNVQAVEILARAQVGVRRGEAFRTRKLAEQTALADRNRALADAAELVGQARVQSVLFQGDREAARQNGSAFLLERWLDRLGAGIGKSGLLVVDHRLSEETPPTIDLRGLGVPGSTQLAFLEPGQSALSSKSEIFARKILMTGIGQNMDQIWTMLDSKSQGIDLAKMQYHADMVSIMLQSLPYLFPASTNLWNDNPQRDAGRDTDASPDIWTHFSDFTAKASAASKFAFDASRARNESDFRDIARNLQDACEGCHLAYRKGEQQP